MTEKSQSLNDLWDNIKRPNICINGILKGEEKEKIVGEIMA